jgi:hypothetical protein
LIGGLSALIARLRDWFALAYWGVLTFLLSLGVGGRVCHGSVTNVFYYYFYLVDKFTFTTIVHANASLLFGVSFLGQ